MRIPGQPTIPRECEGAVLSDGREHGARLDLDGRPGTRPIASKVYDLPQYHDPKWSAVEGDALRIDCHYLSLADNLCDPAHVSFVHLSTLGSAAGEDVPVHTEKQGRQAGDVALDHRLARHPAVSEIRQVHRQCRSLALLPLHGAEHRGDRLRQRADRDRRARRAGATTASRSIACHFITPIDADSCIDHWLFVKNFPTDDATTQAMIEQFRIAFNEDKVILEAIQRNEKEPRSSRPIRLAIDAGTIRMRRMVEQMIEAERNSLQVSGATAA